MPTGNTSGQGAVPRGLASRFLRRGRLAGHTLDRFWLHGFVVRAELGGDVMHQHPDRRAGVLAGIVLPMKNGICQYLLAADKILLAAGTALIGAWARAGARLRRHGNNFAHGKWLDAETTTSDCPAESMLAGGRQYRDDET